jgi:hypothetical protein
MTSLFWTPAEHWTLTAKLDRIAQKKVNRPPGTKGGTRGKNNEQHGNPQLILIAISATFSMISNRLAMQELA